MKVILTERQIKQIIETENVVNLLEESFINDGNIDKLKQKVKKLILAGVAISTVIAAISKANIDDNNKEELIQMATEMEETNAIDTTDYFYQKKLSACRNYMEKALENQNYTLKSTGLKPETLLNASIERGIDLVYLMAAAHLESCFGATPRARKTNSVFSVGSYDDGRNVVTYSDPNESVYGYIDLLNKDYLVNGKTIEDLLKPGCFVNKDGNRYASDKNYEAKITQIMNRIYSEYPVLSYIK